MRPWASLMTQMVKKLPAIWETQVWSLGQEDPLEKGLATHASILAWKISWTEEPEGYSLCCHKESDRTEQLTLSLSWGLISSVPQILTTDSKGHVIYLLFPKRFKKKPTSVCVISQEKYVLRNTHIDTCIYTSFFFGINEWNFWSF